MDIEMATNEADIISSWMRKLKEVTGEVIFKRQEKSGKSVIMKPWNNENNESAVDKEIPYVA